MWISQRDVERFQSNVDQSGGPDACWPWKRYISRDGEGYGRFYANSTGYLAHRVALAIELELDEMPPPEVVAMHWKCDFGACCNPRHLKWATQGENILDMVTKGRRPPRSCPGERNGQARLNEAQIDEIFERRAAGELMPSLAAAFGVSTPTISQILNGHLWGRSAIGLLVVPCRECGGDVERGKRGRQPWFCSRLCRDRSKRRAA